MWPNPAILSHRSKQREYDGLRQQFGSSASSHFKKNYSDQDIFNGPDIQHGFAKMARANDFISFYEMFKQFYDGNYQSFKFKQPGIMGGGFFFGQFGGGNRTKLRQHRSGKIFGHFNRLGRHLF